MLTRRLGSACAHFKRNQNHAASGTNRQANPGATKAAEVVVVVVITTEATLGVSGMGSAATITTIAILATAARITKTVIKAEQTVHSTGGIRTRRMGSHYVQERRIHSQ